MSSVDVLYILIGTCIAVITVASVWLANEAIALIKSLKVSAKNTETISEELKEKTMLVSESLDRVGTVATRVISFVEDMQEAVEQKAGAISSSIGVIAGAKKYFVDGKENQKLKAKDENKEEVKKGSEEKTEGKEPEEKKVEKGDENKAEKDDEKEEEVKEEKVEEVEKEDESLVTAEDEGAKEPEEEVTEVKVKPDKQKAQEVEVEVS